MKRKKRVVDGMIDSFSLNLLSNQDRKRKKGRKSQIEQERIRQVQQGEVPVNIQREILLTKTLFTYQRHVFASGVGGRFRILVNELHLDPAVLQEKLMLQQFLHPIPRQNITIINIIIKVNINIVITESGISLITRALDLSTHFGFCGGGGSIAIKIIKVPHLMWDLLIDRPIIS